MTLPEKTLTLLVFISLGVNALLLLAVIAMATRRRHENRPQAVAMDDVLRGVLDGQAKSFQRLEQAIRQLYDRQDRLDLMFKGAIQRVGLVRYDAFEDVGGRLSFSCATRVYAKPVYHGESTHNHSQEEAAAIREAMVGPRQTVEA